jgi:hypothetical protein
MFVFPTFLCSLQKKYVRRLFYVIGENLAEEITSIQGLALCGVRALSLIKLLTAMVIVHSVSITLQQ